MHRIVNEPKLCYFAYLENSTHLLDNGNYVCMADLLFDWFGLNQPSKSFAYLNGSKGTAPLSNRTGSQLYNDASSYGVN